MTNRTVSRAARAWSLMLAGYSLSEAAERLNCTTSILDREIWDWRPGAEPKPKRMRDPGPMSTEVRRIIQRVADQYGVPFAAIMGRRRKGPLSAVRHAAYHAVKSERKHLSFPQVGAIFGRDHTSIMHGYYTHEARLLWCEILRAIASIDDQPDLFEVAA